MPQTYKLGQQHLSTQLKLQKAKARGKLMRYFSHYNRNGKKHNSSIDIGDGDVTELNETQANTNQHTTISSNNQDGSTNAVSNLGSARVITQATAHVNTSPAPRMTT